MVEESRGPGRPTNEERMMAATEKMIVAASYVEELSKSIKILNSNITMLGISFEKKLHKSVKTISRQTEKLEKKRDENRSKRDPFSFNKILYEFRSLNLGFTALTAQLGFTFKKADDYQKQLLKTGTSLGKFTNVFGESIKSIPTNFKDAIEVALEDYSTGSKSVSKNLLLLAAREKVNDGNSLKLIQVLRATNAITGGNRENLDKLSLNILRSSNQYKISAEQMVDAIAGLSDRMLDFASFNRGTEFADVIKDLTGILGANFTPQIQEFIRQFTDTDPEALIRAALLGVEREREEFFRNPTIENLIVAIQKSASTFESTLGNVRGRQSGLALDLTKQMFGTQGQVAKALSDGLDNLSTDTRKSLETEINFNKNFEAFSKYISDWTNKLTTDVYPVIIDTLIGIKDTLKIIAGSFILGSTFKGLGEFLPFLAKIAPSFAALTRLAPALIRIGAFFTGPVGLSIAALSGILISMVASLKLFSKTNDDILKQYKLKEVKTIVDKSEQFRFQVTAQQQILDSLRTIELTKSIQETMGVNSKETVELLRQIKELMRTQRNQTSMPAVSPSLGG